MIEQKHPLWTPWAATRRGLAWLLRLARRPGMRWVRLIGLPLVGTVLMGPYIFRGIVGATDARWYAQTVADYVLQLRAGVFPLWTGQTDFAFYGGVFPLRMAPYLAHLAGVIDLLTFRQLPPYAIMNVMLVASLVGGVLSMYACLRAIAPGRPWAAAGLALCYPLCPGVLGLIYVCDLYMSFCTLPFLPVVFLGVVRSYTRDDLGARLLMVGGVAAAWLAHPPIGMWCGLVAGATQVVRWCTRPSWRTIWRYDVPAAGLFVLLAGYPVVSVRELGSVTLGGGVGDQHYASVQLAFPASWWPLHSTTRDLSSLQLGYGLALLALFVATQACGMAQRLARLFLFCAAGLLLLLLPVPGLTLRLWQAMPETVLRVTNIWPMQRLLPVLAVCLVFGCGVWLSRFAGPWPVRRRFYGLLLVALLWGASEAAKFIRLADRAGPGWRQTAVRIRPENRALTHSALGPSLTQMRYFNNGVTDVQLEHRFLARDTKEIIHNGTDAIIPGFGPLTGNAPRRLTQQFTAQRDPSLDPAIVLEPGKHYLLALEFLDLPYQGTLVIEGRDFYRVYHMPEAGYARALGAKPENARWIALWQSTAQPVEVRLRWVPLPGAPGNELTPGQPFANYALQEYDPARQDVVLESLMPYRAKVNAPAASYLETPRAFIPGYAAMVDGRPTPVETSPDGLVMVPLEQGQHVVALSYTAPLATRVAYYTSLAGWLFFLVFCVRYFCRAAEKLPAGS